jgi:phosphoglycolate phosphatase-like HAD superfamily hydrolase
MVRNSPYASCDGRADGSYHKFGCANRCERCIVKRNHTLKTHTVDVLDDLGISEYLSPVLISEVERVKKPSISIFLAACVRGGATPFETVHVGDDFRE